jgi:tetratricopeptide (TPR) repeat protein
MVKERITAGDEKSSYIREALGGRTMTTVDIITLSIAGLALIVSLGSAIYTAIYGGGGKYDQQRTIRNQLTDVLKQIFDTQLELVRQSQDAVGKSPMYMQNINGVLGQQNAALLSQATYLADQIQELVTPVEYTTIAMASAQMGNYPQANKCAKRAVDISKDNYIKAIASRVCANILFSQGEIETGRQYFNSAVSLLQGEDNLDYYTKGFTYQFWAASEKTFATSDNRAEDLFEKARKEYQNISIQMVQDKAINELEMAISELNANASPILHPQVIQSLQSQHSFFGQMNKPQG